MIVFYWLIAAAVFLVAEVLTLGLTTIWFAGGALVGALLAALKLPFYVQILAFALVSAVLLLLTRPLAQKYLNSRTIRTNAESLIGLTCIVTEPIDNLKAQGQVSIKGQIWSARSISDDLLLDKDEKVRVEGISGVKLIVRPLGVQ
jgi:membrane protein implicated in regulation of membrane protease activity